jgi:hypothetical protein
MATELHIFRSMPSTVIFDIQATGNDPVYFKATGAAGLDKDLSNLVPGPLRSYLNRLPPFAWQPYPDLAGVSGRVLLWRRQYKTGSYYETPVTIAPNPNPGPGASTQSNTLDVNIDQAGPSGQWFSFTPGSADYPTYARIELSFIRSQNR